MSRTPRPDRPAPVVAGQLPSVRDWEGRGHAYGGALGRSSEAREPATGIRQGALVRHIGHAFRDGRSRVVESDVRGHFLILRASPEPPIGYDCTAQN